MRSHSAVAALLAWAVLCGGTASSVDAQSVRIPGTSVAMTPPAGFRVTRGAVAGLENAAGSSITVAEYPPDSYAELAAVFASPKSAASRFAADGVKITRIEQLAVASGSIPLAMGSQEKNGRELTKYITIFGGEQRKCAVVTFNLVGSDLRRSDVEEALRSVALERIPTLAEKIARLSFTFEAAAPFRTTDVLAENTALLATFDGTDPSGMKPMVLISQAATTATPAEAPQLAEQELRGMSGFRDAAIAERGAVTFAGGPGRYVAAVADGKTMLQFLRVLPGGSYIRLVARGETSALEDARSAVKQIAASVKLP